MTTTITTSNQHQRHSQNIVNSDDDTFSFEFTTEEYCSTCSNENHHQQTLVQKDFNPTFYNPFETKHRRRTSRTQFKLLEASFYDNTKPNATMRRWLAQKLGMTPRSVQVWFQNRRAKAKAQLKRQYSSSSSLSYDNEMDDHGSTNNNNNSDPSCFVPSTDQSHCCQNQNQQQQQQLQQYQCSPLTPLSCFSSPINDDVHQWQLTCDPLSMLMDQQQQPSPPGLMMSWYTASSPISSPLPSSPPSSTYSHYTDAPFDPMPMSLKEPFHHQLSEPIFDLQPSTMMMMIPQQSQPQSQPLGTSFF